MSRRRKSAFTRPAFGQLNESHVEEITQPHKLYELHRSTSLPENLGERIPCARLRHKNYDSGFFESDRPNSVSFHPEIILINVVTNCDANEVKTILQDKTIDVNYKMSSGMSILHYASSAGNYDCLRLLIEAGATINVLDDQQRSPLDLAVRNGFFDCARELIENGAKIENIVNGGSYW